MAESESFTLLHRSYEQESYRIYPRPRRTRWFRMVEDQCSTVSTG